MNRPIAQPWRPAMADINRDDDTVELVHPPRFAMGERVASRSVVRNDGTYNGRDIGDVLVTQGRDRLRALHRHLPAAVLHLRGGVHRAAATRWACAPRSCARWTTCPRGAGRLGERAELLRTLR
jgi:nitrogen fixation protein NifZ